MNIFKTLVSAATCAALCMTLSVGFVAAAPQAAQYAGSQAFTAEAAQSVYLTQTGSKYHMRWCRTLYRSKHLTKVSVKKAKSRGYSACKVCLG
ncbi:MAG: hypothetical protein ACI36V_06670 [Coriobacteriales bacterium]